MKQLTIYDLLPLLRKGWVAYDKRTGWNFYDKKPVTSSKYFNCWLITDGDYADLSFCFNIAPFDGDWKNSLMRCGK